MKKRNLKNLKLTKQSISNLTNQINGGAETGGYCETILRSFLYGNCPIDDPGEPLPLTADVLDCPDNSLYGSCSLGYCVETFWCKPS
ncbi:hypothetical protein [Kordia zhangzhouensis]|uniref:hypothetical protein n=1 Tax=Kordia zhangzhouensis TaxID=1620405 RepID=UPI00062915A4|nr:hypothetical protein [Kordia zhangzhouensis]